MPQGAALRSKRGYGTARRRRPKQTKLVSPGSGASEFLTRAVVYVGLPFEVEIRTKTKRAGASAPTLCSPSLVSGHRFSHPVFRILLQPPRTPPACARAPQALAQ